MTTARAASSATPSVASAPRRAAALRGVRLLREVALQEAAQGVRLRGNRTVDAVAPAVTTMAITTHRAAVAEAVGDNFCHKTDKTSKTYFQHIGRATAPNRDAVAYPD